MSWKAIDRYSKDYVEMQTKDKVRFYKTPDSMLQKQLEVFDQVEAKKSAENPTFKEIAESQRAFAARAVKWDLDTNVQRRMAYNHYFAKAAAKPAALRLRKANRTAQICALSPAIRDRPDGWFFIQTMKAQPLLRIVDQISYWVGKAFAWLIVAADVRRRPSKFSSATS